MDPWFELLQNARAQEDNEQESPLLHIARFLRQMAAMDDLDTSQLAPPASKEAVKELKRTKNEEDLDVQCPICLKIIESGEISVTMPCKHEFHDECMLAWLNKTNSCPVCRHELRTDDVIYEERRENKRREAQRANNVQNLHYSMYS